MDISLRQVAIAPLVAALLSAPAAQAGDKPPANHAPDAKALSAVVECRRITDSAARLACYDNNVSQLESAVAKRDVVVVEREEVQKTRRSLFGFSLPSLRLFGDNEDGKPENQELVSTVRSAHRDGYGHWVIQLEDGAVWQQVDDQSIARWPKAGTQILIRRGALGAYVMRVDNQSGFKVRRAS